jgi:hypothetical protein
LKKNPRRKRKMSKFHQKKEALVEAISSLISEETDEVAAEHVRELIEDLVKEALSNHLGELDEDDEEEDVEYHGDMDDFSEEDT